MCEVIKVYAIIQAIYNLYSSIDEWDLHISNFQIYGLKLANLSLHVNFVPTLDHM